VIDRAEARSPYVGLTAYGEADADRMFGRRRDAGLVADHARSARLTLVYGPSGVGKSSLLRAGVIPRLREGAERLNRTLAVAYLSSWRDDPIEALRAELIAATGQASEVPPPPGSPLADTLHYCEELVGGRLVIVLDQLEDYFVYGDAGDHRLGRFSAEFPDCVAESGPGTSFVLSLREDALAKLDVFADRIPRFYDILVRIAPLTRAQAYEAIVRPLEWSGAQIEPALVDAVLEELTTGAVSTLDGGWIDAPYLQLVMSRVWEAEVEEGSAILRLETLVRLGGTLTIIRGSVDNGLAPLDLRSREIAAQLLRFMITPSGMKVAHTAADLAEYADVPIEDVLTTIEQLTAARLVRPLSSDGERRYEIFHDVLTEPLLDWSRREELERRQRVILDETVGFFGRRISNLTFALWAVVGLLIIESLALLSFIL
jgi:hypothetical protein